MMVEIFPVLVQFKYWDRVEKACMFGHNMSTHVPSLGNQQKYSAGSPLIYQAERRVYCSMVRTTLRRSTQSVRFSRFVIVENLGVATSEQEQHFLW